jgi:hypothetical protein
MPLLGQMRANFLVYCANVMRQPVAEKIQQLHRHGRAARFERLLELDNFFSQCLMLRFVLLIEGIAMRLHQNLLIREVALGICDQIAECVTQTLLSLAAVIAAGSCSVSWNNLLCWLSMSG